MSYLINILLLGAFYFVNAEISHNYGGKKSEGPDLQKVSFTQRGYIQFLKYVTDAPVISDFTFCIWIRSTNLTYSQPIFSYSRQETQRLIRVWISEYGKQLNMAILENDVFKIDLNMKEKYWYHICPSWNSKKAIWNLYLNGRLKETGITASLRGIKIPSSGDIVVGQEFTDFNKGLDDGIEGDVFGFNLILSSTTSDKTSPYDDVSPAYPSTQVYNPTKHLNDEDLLRPYYSNYNLNNYNQNYYKNLEKGELQNLEAQQSNYIPNYHYQHPQQYRQGKGLMDVGKSMLQNIYKMMEENRKIPEVHVVRVKGLPGADMNTKRLSGHTFRTDMIDYYKGKSLALSMIEIGYSNCAFGKGAPLASDKVLVSWTKTPVRVFGGAMLKSVKSFCRR